MVLGIQSIHGLANSDVYRDRNSILLVRLRVLKAEPPPASGLGQNQGAETYVVCVQLLPGARATSHLLPK